MKPLIAIILLLCLSGFAQAADLAIVDVRKNIPLSDSEDAYKDFYIAGDAVGSLKKNMVVTALRRTSIRDAKGTQSYGEIDIPVGQLRVLGVFGNVAVAREYKLLSRDEHPMLEQTGLMAGDRIETKGSFIDNKPAPKKKTAALAPPAPASASASVAAVTTAAPAGGPAEPTRETASTPAATPPPGSSEGAAPTSGR